MASRGIKIAVIGGGSSYTPELMEGLIRNVDILPVREVWLVDIEAGREKLDIVGSLAKRMVEKAAVPIKVHLTLNRREAIAGADYVVTQLRVGLLDARARDERIPLKYGCIGQETTGAGGFAKALRTIPVILDICKDIEELSPNAVLFNFTNPAGLVTEAVLKYSNVKCVGLCNLPIGMRMSIAKALSVDESRIQTEMVGINHLNWTTRIFLDGDDITDSFLDKYVGAADMTPKNIPDLRWDRDLLNALHAVPCGYLRYYYMTDQMLEEQLESARTVGTRAEVVKRVEAELFELYRDVNLAVKPKQLEQRGGAYYSEAAVRLMTSMYNNTRDIQTVNVRNGHTIPFLPPDVSIEVNCVIGRDGAYPLQPTAELSGSARGLLQVVKAYESLTVEAAVHGDRLAALEALTVHPLIPSVSVAKKLLHEILAANEAYLPQFK
ncbi:6-phospho-beta-glucosidase [Alicyclobacillus shizuokensis]|uniref:6-phospho-beta-glucosidase n=1 Tax=Alicyclobacillus shizuokensis TaxID=392014 RepID=UPI00083521AD|nr:6-phospho-beta-glucosidase [Alicyclobacillus shizuokensis]MCL6625261.1 6-phospho-beta-glucosidase [Alicyclobacillus shizuokensis]